MKLVQYIVTESISVACLALFVSMREVICVWCISIFLIPHADVCVFDCFFVYLREGVGKGSIALCLIDFIPLKITGHLATRFNEPIQSRTLGHIYKFFT